MAAEVKEAWSSGCPRSDRPATGWEGPAGRGAGLSSPSLSWPLPRGPSGPVTSPARLPAPGISWPGRRTQAAVDRPTQPVFVQGLGRQVGRQSLPFHSGPWLSPPVTTRRPVLQGAVETPPQLKHLPGPPSPGPARGLLLLAGAPCAPFPSGDLQARERESRVGRKRKIEMKNQLRVERNARNKGVDPRTAEIQRAGTQKGGGRTRARTQRDKK